MNSVLTSIVFLLSRLHSKYNDKDNDDGGDDSDGWSDLDRDDDSDLDASDSDDDDSDSDDEDEEEALQAELAKIRAEREQAKAKVDAEVSSCLLCYGLARMKVSSVCMLTHPVCISTGSCSRGIQDGRGGFDWKSFVGRRSCFGQDETTLE